MPFRHRSAASRRSGLDTVASLLSTGHGRPDAELAGFVAFGAENTFSGDLTEFDAKIAELQPLIDKVWRHCEEKDSRGRTVTLKLKFNDFEIITRSRSVPVAASSRSDLEQLSIALLQHEIPLPKPVRLLGVSLSSLQGDGQEEPQLGLPI